MGSATTDFVVGPTGFVESMEANGFEHGQNTFHVATTLSKPTPFDNGILSWEKFGPPPNPNFAIDAASREVFERAAKLYGESTGLTTKIAGTALTNGKPAKMPTWTADVAWERRGRLRIKSSHSPIVLAFDGTNSYVITDGSLRKVITGGTSLDEVTFQILGTLASDEKDPFRPFNELLVNLLRGRTTDFTAVPEGVDSRKVTLETGVILYNLPCNVVKVVMAVQSRANPVNVQRRYWFAKSDGRLLRVTSTLKLKDSQTVTDVRLTGQQINPNLPDSTWVLTAPVKAKPTR